MNGTYRLFGTIGSPYSMKMRAVLRYRRIPFVWIHANPTAKKEFAHVRPPVIPVLQFPDDGSYHVDSTPLIYELEKRHRQRSIVPDDPGLAFLAHVIEDMADEWVTKAMFLYRWWREVDQNYCGLFIALVSDAPVANNTARQFADYFIKRQVERMPLVGCTEITKPVIEESFQQLIGILDRSLQTSKHLLGSRPSLADFGLFGQLYQLNHDPTPLALMRDLSPRVCSWVLRMDDISGDEDGEWIDITKPLPDPVLDLLKMAGTTYFPFLLANEKAFNQNKETFSLTLFGKPFEQGTFKYQVKCLNWLRDEYRQLTGTAKAIVDTVLDDTGCLEAFQN